MTAAAEFRTGPPRAARAAVLMAFFVLGATFANWVPRIPAVKADLGLRDGELGLALLGLALGVVAALPVAARLLARNGSRQLTRVAIVAQCLALPLPALAWDLPSLAAALFLFGVTGGLLDPAMNAHAVEVERRYGRPLMSSFHGLYSVGGFAGAAIGGLAARAGIDPALHLAVAGLVIGVAGVLGSARLLPAAADRPETPAPGRRRSGGWSRGLVLLGLIGFCSFVGEGAAADWSAVYLRDSLGADPGTAAAGFAAFSVAMATMRFAGDRLTARLGPVRVVRWGSVVAAAGLGAGLMAGQPLAAIAGFGLLGAGLAAVAPVTFSAAGNSDAGPGGASIARVSSIGYSGMLLGPPVIGWLADHTGLASALAVPVVLAAIIALSAGAVAPAAGNEAGNDGGGGGAEAPPPPIS
jgi:MFS family permease